MKFSIQVVKENIMVNLSSDPKPFYVKEEEVKKKTKKPTSTKSQSHLHSKTLSLITKARTLKHSKTARKNKRNLTSSDTRWIGEQQPWPLNVAPKNSPPTAECSRVHTRRIDTPCWARILGRLHPMTLNTPLPARPGRVLRPRFSMEAEPAEPEIKLDSQNRSAGNLTSASNLIVSSKMSSSPYLQQKPISDSFLNEVGTKTRSSPLSSHSNCSVKCE